MKGIWIRRVAAVVVFAGAVPAEAVILFESGDPSFHTTTPGDNSGWQYEGRFGSFLGVPIGPYHFITAIHIGGAIGNSFTLHGDTYTTIGFQNCPGTDIRIWEVNHAKPFPTWAPLSSGAADIGAAAAVFGRGTQRGDEVIVSGEPKGWKWGAGDGVQRWGRNVIADAVDGGPSLGELLMCNFDHPGLPGECHLSSGDSGGGIFVLEDGLWRLAAINYGVDGPFRVDSSPPQFHAALYDVGGMEYYDGANWIPVPEDDDDVQSSFYASRISTSLSWITSVVPEASALANEDFAAWQKWYFTPAEIATPSLSGPLADYDMDGISNLLEFALNLDPTFSERAVMEPATGLRGLPCMRLESDGGGIRLTVEFVRRTVASGANLTCTARFSSDIQTWAAVGTESVTPINPRWERVKVVDSETTLSAPRRFAQLQVVIAD